MGEIRGHLGRRLLPRSRRDHLHHGRRPASCLQTQGEMAGEVGQIARGQRERRPHKFNKTRQEVADQILHVLPTVHHRAPRRFGGCHLHRRGWTVTAGQGLPARGHLRSLGWYRHRLPHLQVSQCQHVQCILLTSRKGRQLHCHADLPYCVDLLPVSDCGRPTL